MGARAGISGLGFTYVMTQHSARVELYIDRGDLEKNQRVYQHFVDQADEIECAFRRAV